MGTVSFFLDRIHRPNPAWMGEREKGIQSRSVSTWGTFKGGERKREGRGRGCQKWGRGRKRKKAHGKNDRVFFGGLK